MLTCMTVGSDFNLCAILKTLQFSPNDFQFVEHYSDVDIGEHLPATRVTHMMLFVWLFNCIRPEHARLGLVECQQPLVQLTAS